MNILFNGRNRDNNEEVHEHGFMLNRALPPLQVCDDPVDAMAEFRISWRFW